MQYFNKGSLAQAGTYEDLRIMADLPRFYARETPDQIATIYQEHETTYAELDQFASQIANGLIADDVSTRGHIACLDVNTDALFQLALGCAKSNNVLCMINWRLAGPINGNIHMEFALFGPDLGNVDVEITNRIDLKLLLWRLVSADIGQTGDLMPLEEAMQRGACQVWDRRLQGIETVIQRQQRMPPEGNTGCLFLCGQHR